MSITLPYPDHVRAFSNAFTAIWDRTPFMNEVNNLAYFRALTCFIGDEETDLEDRRYLMYKFLSNDFGATKQDDTIVHLYNLLPIDESINRVIRNLCTLYNQTPARKFDINPEKCIETYELGAINDAMKTAHKLGKVLNTALVMPTVRDGKIEIDVFPPDLFRVVTDSKDFKRITELWIPISTIDSNGTSVYTFKVWSDTTYRTVASDGREMTTEPNKYGIIPAAILQFNPSRTNFYGGAMWSLLLATLDNNKLTFLANNDVVYSAFSVWIASNFGKDIRISPNHLIAVNNIQQGEGFDAPPNLESVAGAGVFLTIEELKDIRNKNAMRIEGLPESLVSSNPSLAPSGVAMQIDRMELMEIRRTDIAIMQRFENLFYRIFAVVINKDLRLNLPLENKVGIDYVETGEYIEPADRQTTINDRFNKGIIGAKDYLSNFTQNENITTDEEAIDYMLTNLKLLERLKIDTPATEIQEPSTGGVIPA